MYRLSLFLLHACSFVVCDAVQTEAESNIFFSFLHIFSGFSLPVLREYISLQPNNTFNYGTPHFCRTIYLPRYPRNLRGRTPHFRQSRPPVASTSSVSRTTANSISFSKPVPITKPSLPVTAGTSSARPISTIGLLSAWACTRAGIWLASCTISNPAAKTKPVSGTAPLSLLSFQTSAKPFTRWITVFRAFSVWTAACVCTYMITAPSAGTTKSL